jgi:hypothetical protein
MPKISVRGNEYIEILLRSRQELAIAELRPAGFKGGAHVVTAQMLAQRYRNTLIEKDAH